MNRIIKAPVVEYKDIHYVTILADTKDVHLEHKKEDRTSLKTDVEARYEHIIKEALLQKEEILKEARAFAEVQKKEAEQIGYEQGRETGYSEGYSEGYKKGLEEGKKEAQVIIDEANRLKQQIEEERSRLLKQLEVDVVELVYSCIEDIIGKMEYNELHRKVVHEAVRRLGIKDRYEVRVSEDDYALLDKDYIETAGYRIISDPTLRRGDIIIDTPDGGIDCGIISQMQNIKKELRGILLDEK